MKRCGTLTLKRWPWTWGGSCLVGCSSRIPGHFVTTDRWHRLCTTQVHTWIWRRIFISIHSQRDNHRGDRTLQCDRKRWLRTTDYFELSKPEKNNSSTTKQPSQIKKENEPKQLRPNQCHLRDSPRRSQLSCLVWNDMHDVGCNSCVSGAHARISNEAKAPIQSNRRRANIDSFEDKQQNKTEEWKSRD